MHLFERARVSRARELFTWLLSAMAVCASAQAAEISTVPVIVDADTVYADRLKIRLSGIDAPESEQICLDSSGHNWTCGIEAKIRLETWGKDRRGHVDRRV